MAESVAKALKDGKNWTDDEGTNIYTMLEGTKVEQRGVSFWPFTRHEFDDGSAIIITPEWWDLEGSRPWVCAGAEEEGEVGGGVDEHSDPSALY